MKLKSPNELEELRKLITGGRDVHRPCITICSGTGCHAYGCEAITQAFIKELKKQKIDIKVDIKTTGCHGFCEKGPIVVIRPHDIFYQRVKIEDVEEIVSKTLLKNKIIDRLLYVDPSTGKKVTYEKDIPFYARQKRLILGNNGLIDPESIDDYIAIGAVEKLKSKGYRVPEDISIIGMDDMELSSEIEPPLTTIKINTEKIGTIGIRKIINMIKDNHKEEVKTIIENSLIIRKSCKRLGV